MPTAISNLTAAPLSITHLLLNLGVGTILSLILAWHYTRFGRALANRAALARTFPFIVLTTALVITVVKSSLALSLGLVGALSIVRFRTPIKEPEELAYLFLCIAIGLGLGANQIIATIIAAPVIMVIVALISVSGRRRRDENLFLNVQMPQKGDGSEWFKKVNDVLAPHVDVADLRRMDVAADQLQITYFVHCKRDENMLAAMSSLQESFPDASITLVEQQNFLGG